MIDNYVDNETCCGCKACGDKCPKNAIVFQATSNGFWVPKVDYDMCVKCGLCLKTCPVIDKEPLQKACVKCFGAWSKNEELRSDSTSGGIFSELAYEWLKNDGICVGAAYDEHFNVRHKIIKGTAGLSGLRKSKYVQSDTAGIYKEVKKFLDNREKVLFSGTPCQIEALLKFLGKEYSNLFTVDFICCGVPSPLAYEKYKELLEKKANSKIKSIWFKNKELGWHNLGTKVEFENNRKYFRTGNRDLYMVSYIEDGLTIRNSCTKCKFRNIPHISDITIGDFWGIEVTHPSYNDDKGTSAVIVNTEKGMELFNAIKSKINYFDTTIENIAFGNFTLYKSKELNNRQSDFFDLMKRTDYKKAMSKFGSYKGLNKIKTDMKFAIKKLLRRR